MHHLTNPIDLRSDTVTQPSPAMRRAMYEAEVGDDVHGEDPTINALQERAAAIMGKEAALFVASGTQGNLVAILTHCTRGDEIIVGHQAHILHYEVGGASALAGVKVRAVPNRWDGSMDPAQVREVIRDRTDVHCPYTRLICLENTQNRCGGVVLDVAYMRVIHDLAREADCAVHLDGARIFNAAMALGVTVAEVAENADSVMFCASKGLGAPVGSLLCGSRAFINRALRWRKMVGGGMRQAGIIAAGALYALDQMVNRLAEDHRLARVLAEGLAEIPGVSIDLRTVQTNIVIFGVAKSGHTAAEVAQSLDASGVLCEALGPDIVRFVTHYGIEQAQAEEALARTALVLRDLQAPLTASTSSAGG